MEQRKNQSGRANPTSGGNQSGKAEQPARASRSGQRPQSGQGGTSQNKPTYRKAASGQAAQAKPTPRKRTQAAAGTQQGARQTTRSSGRPAQGGQASKSAQGGQGASVTRPPKAGGAQTGTQANKAARPQQQGSGQVSRTGQAAQTGQAARSQQGAAGSGQAARPQGGKAQGAGSAQPVPSFLSSPKNQRSPRTNQGGQSGTARNAQAGSATRGTGASAPQNRPAAQGQGRGAGHAARGTAPRTGATRRSAGGGQRQPSQNRGSSGAITPIGTQTGRRQQRPVQRKSTAPIHIPVSTIVFGVALVGIIAGALFWYSVRPITVSVNGTEVEITTHTAQAAYEAAGEPVPYGDLLDVEGELLEEGAGGEPQVTVNSEEKEFTSRVHAGDELVFTRGEDEEEASTVTESEEIPYDTVETGTGPIYSITQEGQNGLATVKYGEVSGKTVTVVEQEPVDQVYERWYPDTGDDKVIALTFDDGPSTSYTSEILDILAEYDIKATFFTIGEQITGEGAELVLREYEEGHQVCTHTWDHAAGDGNGVNLSYMTASDQRDEITKGLQAITDVIGVEASTVIRAPGGNFPLEVWQNIEDLISAQVIWTIDTEDWSRPGTSAIASAIKSATSGDIVLMHDGGGNRSQTVEALKIAIPYLIEQGYTFVTLDELMEYPALES